MNRLLNPALLFICAFVVSCDCNGTPPPATDVSKEFVEVESNLPGVDRISSDVSEQIAGAEPVEGEPRTRHLRDGGEPRYTNRLILESSSYLRQHAHNPVNWFPWSNQAFERARELGRPVLLSVGHSTCRWCQVMAEESFDDVEIARYLNENYVAIKVDREERPDVDRIYMESVHVLTSRSGAWPMTVWLTEERDPFLAGTYFQPRSDTRRPGVGFLELLEAHASRYENDRSAVVASARDTATRIAKSLERPAAPELENPEVAMIRAFEVFSESFDDIHGGWGRADKFPMPSRLLFLLQYHRRSADEKALEMVVKTLDNMLSAGVWDVARGGFYRYAVDRAWQVPHFEKMLYGNAQLLMVLTEAYRVVDSARYRQAASAIVDYLERELKSDEFDAYYAASDPRGEHRSVDTILIAGWNGLYLEALARAAFVFDVPEWRERAEALGAFLMRHCVTEEGLLLHSISQGRPGPMGFADDYAFVIAGLLELFQVTGERTWLSDAIALQTRANSLFRDGEDGGYFYYNPDQHDELWVRPTPYRDGAIPSANGVMALNLLKLHRITLAPVWQKDSLQTLDAFSGVLRATPYEAPRLLLAVDFHTDTAKEVAIIHSGETSAAHLLDVMRDAYNPNLVRAHVREAETTPMQTVVPWLKDKKMLDGMPTAYVCQMTKCKLPTSDPVVFRDQLAEVDPL